MMLLKQRRALAIPRSEKAGVSWVNLSSSSFHKFQAPRNHRAQWWQEAKLRTHGP